MKIEMEDVLPEQIERRSFEIIEGELPHPLDPALAPIIKRVIHTTADFDYADSLYFSESAVPLALAALKAGAPIVTDTNMVRAGINKPALERLGGEAYCFMQDADVAAAARRNGTTRAAASMDKAATLDISTIFAIGNAPTALARLCELIGEGRIRPALIIGVPVGFVNVVQAKERIMQTAVPCIVARGRKGGSNVAAAIVNALMYMLTREP
ncbi:MAG: precorrin-8X methylmutase [Christensenellaceae bacterium]|nr:precorrin-8X methylmutase [Christensenellaceae bacterium]MEA5066538.1 precorrin-8X methylmutase [Eubacteriales bacterium]MEA5068470.1 precorrin-8X methylmutase [Christensenellaceae bacterium]